MTKNKPKIVDYDSVLDEKFGKEGSKERNKHEEQARAFYAVQILHQARKDAKITQSELANRVGTTKSYISKIENGIIEPGIGLFFRLANALGVCIEFKTPNEDEIGINTKEL